MKKLSCLLMALAMLAAALIGCQPSPNAPADSEETEAPENGSLYIVRSGLASEYRIICADRADDTVNELVVKLQQAIYEKTGVRLEITTDFVKEGTNYQETEAEILIGQTNRLASAQAGSYVAKLNDYCIYTDASKVAICAGSEEALEVAVDAFIEKYVANAQNSEIVLAKNDVTDFNAPYPIESLSIGGAELGEFSIVATTSTQAAAVLLQNAIKESVGYLLPIVATVKNGAKAILVDKPNDEQVKSLQKTLGKTEAAYRCENGNLVFATGDYVTSDTHAVAKFIMDNIVPASSTVAVQEGALQKWDTMNDQTSIDSSYLETLQAKADEMKEKILSSEPDLAKRTRIYYVSNQGNDQNSGTSPESAWATLEKVNAIQGSSGVAVLFECGGEWRGTLKCKGKVLYSHYGDTSKGLPILNGSLRDYADASYWKQTKYPNVYECTYSFTDVGIIAFDHDNSYGDYDALVGSLLFQRNNTKLSEADLSRDLQFYCDSTTKKLYLYSKSGNPGTRFDSIEIGDDISIVNLASNVTLDGLRVRYTGGHGISGGTTSGVTVQNCVCDWIGGSRLGSDSTYGNAIQIYGTALNCKLDNNWCYQIYDCGVTIQCTSGAAYESRMENVSMSGNLLEYCHWGIEFWNQKSEKYNRTFENITMNNNFIRFTSMGWGDATRDEQYAGAGDSILNNGAAFCCFGLTEKASNVQMNHNIIELSLSTLVRMDYYGGENIKRSGNTYVQYVDEMLLRMYGTKYMCGSTSGEDIEAQLNEADYKLVLIEKE